jgi:hypothetical protein
VIGIEGREKIRKRESLQQATSNMRRATCDRQLAGDN